MSDPTIIERITLAGHSVAIERVGLNNFYVLSASRILKRERFDNYFAACSAAYCFLLMAAGAKFDEPESHTEQAI